jgi:hypothetical protein
MFFLSTVIIFCFILTQTPFTILLNFKLVPQAGIILGVGFTVFMLSLLNKDNTMSV